MFPREMETENGEQSTHTHPGCPHKAQSGATDAIDREFPRAHVAYAKTRGKATRGYGRLRALVMTGQSASLT